DGRAGQRRALRHEPQSALCPRPRCDAEEVNRRDFLIASAAAALAPIGRLHARAPAVAPADAWPQFRGTPSLTGLSSTTIAAAPKVAWTWEGGEAFDSSPCIADGVVYVGTATGELIAVNLA